VLPADVVVVKRDDGKFEVRQMSPQRSADGIMSSAATECLAVIPEKERGKPVTGLWLTGDGCGQYLKAEPIDTGKHLVTSSKLWGLDTRVGIGLDPGRRR